MFIAPIVLLAALLVIVFGANSMKKKGQLSESAYQMILSGSSVVVTIAALFLLYTRLSGR